MNAVAEARARLVALGLIPADAEAEGPGTGPEIAEERPDEGRLVVENGLPVRYVKRLPKTTIRDRLPFLVSK